jgi:hypothetical protein
MRAEDVTGIANKVAKRGERAQELIHKAKGTDKFYLSLLGWSLAMMHNVTCLRLEKF